MKNNTETIQSLRQKGYKVRVIHRMAKNADNEFINVDRLAKDSNPNVTEIEVTTPDKTVSVFGFSYRAKGDQYHRKLGNLIALNRAMATL
jgi:hypothetical protein